MYYMLTEKTLLKPRILAYNKLRSDNGKEELKTYFSLPQYILNFIQLLKKLLITYGFLDFFELNDPVFAGAGNVQTLV